MKNLLQYSNGWGHLIMSLCFAAIALALILVPGADATAHQVGYGILSTVVAAWFVPNAARQVAYQVTMHVTNASAAPTSSAPAPAPADQAAPPAPTVTPGTGV